MATKTASEKSDLSVHLSEHPNVTRTRDGFDAFGRGDLDAVHASFTDTATWTNAGTSAIAGTHSGWDEIVKMFGTLLEVTGGTFVMDVKAILADDERSVTIYDATSTINGKTATERFCLIDDLTPEGKITATQVIAYDQAAADAHFSG